ncbi:MAG: PEP-CTERM sorting domain-containing protein [Burkholderiales bacterium]
MNVLRSLLVVVGISLAVSSPAAADPTLNLTIDDHVGIGFDVDVNAPAGTGLVSYNGVIGSWNVNFASGVGVPSISSSEIDLNSINVTNGAGSHHLTIVLTQTGSSLATGLALFTAVNALGGTSPDIAWLACIDSACSSGGSHTGSLLGFSANDGWAGSILDASNFTLRIIIDIFHTGPQATSFNSNLLLASVQRLPEPGSLVLLVATLLGFVAAGRRRRR